MTRSRLGPAGRRRSSAGSRLLAVALAALAVVAGCDRSNSSTAPEPTAPEHDDQQTRRPPDSPLATVADDLESKVVVHYANLAETVYRDAAERAETLHDQIDLLLDRPTADHLSAARGAWVDARRPYAFARVFQTDDAPSARRRLRDRIGARPVASSELEAPAGADTPGLVGEPDVPLTRESVLERDDERAATGYHAIEFLLWGRDDSPHGPGDRPVADFRIDASSPETKTRRRRLYLNRLARWLVEDLHRLADAWSDGEETYRTDFLSRPRADALAQMLRGVIRLTRHIADDGLRPLLADAPARPPVSRFSDNTRRDLVAATRTLTGVYTGTYHRNDRPVVDGPGLERLVAELAPELDDRCHRQLDAALETVRALPQPLDRAAHTDAGRHAIRRAAGELDRQAEVLEEIKKHLEL